MPLASGEVVSYLEMCREESASLQRGMNFRLRPSHSVVLMSVRPGAPYVDQVVENGNVLIYEGHDLPRSRGGENPKRIDQPIRSPSGTLTQNGLFYEAALSTRRGESQAEPVRVYEKIRTGIWSYSGLFRLTDAWQEASGGRQVFKFRLEITDELPVGHEVHELDIEHTRIIPTAIKLAVWKRDHGRCVLCGESNTLHFDHDIPYSKGGSSLTAANIRLLCARHNLAKRDRVE